MIRFLWLPLLIVLAGTFVSPARSQPIDEIVQKVEAKITPAKAGPGETVEVRISLQLKAPWATYPTVQKDAGARLQVNKIDFPAPAELIFVGELEQPAMPQTKAVPELDIEALAFYPGGGTWTRKAVVSPKAKAGEVEITIPFRVFVCDKDNCLAPKTYPLKAKITVEGQAKAVEAKYRTEVDTALKKK